MEAIIFFAVMGVFFLAVIAGFKEDNKKNAKKLNSGSYDADYERHLYDVHNKAMKEIYDDYYRIEKRYDKKHGKGAYSRHLHDVHNKAIKEIYEEHGYKY